MGLFKNNDLFIQIKDKIKEKKSIFNKKKHGRREEKRRG